MQEKVQTLADLLRGDVEQVVHVGSNFYTYKNQTYWVVTEHDRGGGPGKLWRWIGQLGHIHAYRKL